MRACSEGAAGRNKPRSKDAKKMLPIRKMTEKFARDPKVRLSVSSLLSSSLLVPCAAGRHGQPDTPSHAASALHRRPDVRAQVPADQDVAKRVFYLQEGRIRVDFHYGHEHITRSSHVFHKDGQSQIVQVDPLAERPQASALLEEYQSLLVAEKDCMQVRVRWVVAGGLVCHATA